MKKAIVLLLALTLTLGASAQGAQPGPGLIWEYIKELAQKVKEHLFSKAKSTCPEDSKAWTTSGGSTGGIK